MAPGSALGHLEGEAQIRERPDDLAHEKVHALALLPRIAGGRVTLRFKVRVVHITIIVERATVPRVARATLPPSRRKLGFSARYRKRSSPPPRQNVKHNSTHGQ